MIERLALRARALRQVRAFFEERGVLEVQTAALGRHAVTDPNIESLAVDCGAAGTRYLQTSPEYAMKRLLAEGSGDIYQVAAVYRAGERSSRHNPEFTLVEWYRLGFSFDALMRETTDLVRGLVAPRLALPAEPELVSYAQAFERALGIDVFDAPDVQLRETAASAGLAASSIAGTTRDDLLDFLMGGVIGPTLGRGRACCLHGYPASQAALAQIDRDDPRTALRFELYVEGLELANGFVELADADEQARRFDADNAVRVSRGQARVAPDTRLLAALRAGLPACAGVAVGFDRVLMLASGAASIDEVLALPFDEA